MTTREKIRRWFKEGRKNKNLTHMLVVCDTFSYEDYPVYVNKKENVEEVYNKYRGKEMQKVMEVYSFRRNLEKQLEEARAIYFD